MTFGAGVDEVVSRAEQALVHGLGLARISLPNELARLEGRFRGAPVVLEARAYRGPRTAYARAVRVRGDDLEIGNVLCLSEPAYALPILGLDLVAVARDTLVAVADLSPAHPDPERRKQELLPLSRRRERRPLALPALEIPSWCAAWFSPEALVTRVSAPAVPLVGDAVHAYVDTYVALARAGAPEQTTSAAVAGAQARYARAHVEHDRGLGLLKKMFSPDLAERFLLEVLFPERAPAWT